MPISVLFTWVWNSTGGSLLSVTFFHAMFNLSHRVFPALANHPAALSLFTLQGAVVLAVVILFGPARLRHDGPGAAAPGLGFARARPRLTG